MYSKSEDLRQGAAGGGGGGGGAVTSVENMFQICNMEEGKPDGGSLVAGCFL